MPSNVQKLVVEKASLDAIPPGGGITDGIAFLSDKNRLINGIKAAETWAKEAIALVKAAPGNPWGDDDEAIADEILRKLEEKRKSRTCSE